MPKISYTQTVPLFAYPLQLGSADVAVRAIPFFICWFWGMQNSERPGGSLNSQFNEICLICLLNVAIFGSKTCKQTEYKVVRKGSKIC